MPLTHLLAFARMHSLSTLCDFFWTKTWTQEQTYHKYCNMTGCAAQQKLLGIQDSEMGTERVGLLWLMETIEKSTSWVHL